MNICVFGSASDDIDKQYIEAVENLGQKLANEGHNLVFYTSGGEFKIRAKIGDFENQLSPYNFFRSNKGYLVNLKYVDGVENGCCIIAGKQLLISRSRKNDFMTALTEFMS